MKTYSLDLREKVLLAYQNNDLSEREIARLFGVSLSFVRDLLKLYRETGHVDPKPHAGGTAASMGHTCWFCASAWIDVRMRRWRSYARTTGP
ncbi:helix-turn-helix domain-containing protein [Plasticicumulans sp.]|uniref:helix-turn-helix domain-containing protein n=1 Tax=Plasticicumulans sp. TaxID=2307179 RepID=UPI00396484D1